MHDIASTVGLGGLSQSSEAVAVWTDGDTVLHEGRYVPKIAIPKGETDARAVWDKKFRMALERRFLAGMFTKFRPVRVPVTALDKYGRPLVTNNNEVKNRDRYQMYVEMARAEGKLPPIIVQPEERASGEMAFFVVDGNHRWFAAKAVGLTEIDGLLLIK
jgi:hypothetical protein